MSNSFRIEHHYQNILSHLDSEQPKSSFHLSFYEKERLLFLLLLYCLVFHANTAAIDVANVFSLSVCPILMNLMTQEQISKVHIDSRINGLDLGGQRTVTSHVFVQEFIG